MYTPRHFAETDQNKLHDLIEHYSFGLLIVNDGQRPEATHLPFMLDRDRGQQGVLRCHVARANPIWQMLRDNDQVLAIFTGPHAYISPDWYESSEQVPTWNYAAVHAYGSAKIIDDDQMMTLLDDLSEINEHLLLPKPIWKTDKLSDELYGKMRKAIVGIEIEITELRGKAKMSQNRKKVDAEGAMQGLQALGGENNQAVVEMMQSCN